MSQSHIGSRLLTKDIVYSVPYESAHFNFNEDATGILLGDIVSPNAGAVYAMRSDGKFGGGIAIEEGTTNLHFSDMGYWMLAGATQNNISIEGFTWAKEIHLPNNQSGNTYAITDIPTVNGATYTFSIWVRVKSGTFTPVQSQIYLQENGGPTNYFSDFTLSGEFQRISVSATIVAGGNFDGASVLLRSSTACVIEIADWQLEQKAFPTSFVNGTRNYGVLRYQSNMINKKEGTIALWIKAHHSPAYRRIITFVGSNPNADGKSDLNLDSVSGSNYLRFKADTLGSVTSSRAIGNNVWTHVACSWGGDGLKVYINGVKEGHLASYTTGIASLNPTVSIGARGDGTGAINGVIDELRIDKVAVSDEEVMSWYIADAPFYNSFDYRGYAY